MEQDDDDNNNFNQYQQQLRRDLKNFIDSPRRKKAPIDIDEALRLQSQASYVQEPAKSSGSSTSQSVSTSSQSTKRQSLDGKFSYSNPNSQARPSPTSTATTQYFYDQDHLRHNNDISVDYIDCLSNNDLVSTNANQLKFGQDNRHQQSAATALGARQSETIMRGIPSCRKHFSRFHRANRVEPDIEHATSDELADLRPNQILNATETQNNNDSTSGSMITSIDQSIHLDQQQQSGNNSGTSVLYPISVSEVKKRTYFIGSVSQDSLLSHDELYRYFPNGRVSIFVCTWNQNRKRAPMNLNDLLLPDRLVYMPDIYAVGIQESFSSQQDYLRDWEIELQTTLGPSHVLLHSCALGTLHLSLFIRRDLIWFCSTPEESLYNSRSMPTNMIKTKGAVSIAFRFFGTSFMFTNCHFPAHENKVKDRIEEYQRIINSIDLPKNLKLLKPRYLSNDSTARFDCVFFMGDLNFRLEQRTFDETIHILEDIFQSKEQSFEVLTQNDELLKVMETQQAFHGFDESQIKFPPTYKFLAQTNKYDRQTKRVPSYTDRILFRSKRQRHIQCLMYDWLPQLLSSDHKPVYCLFDVLIRPGHEQNMVASLNAGLFQRTVYLEALKRRAEDPDGLRENGVGGNLICSIS